MGKGYNNYMCKKPFHPGSKANIKRAWMAEQRTDNEKKKQDDLRIQYEKEQDLYNNKALLSTESKDKLALNFMYEAPPGAKRERQKEDNEPEYKFDWQRKYNAPREDFAKDNKDIKDQPFGIPVRNVRCIKCHQWGHINTDKECPLYNQAHSSSMPTTSMDPMKLMQQMREDGLSLKQNILGHQINPSERNQQFLTSEEEEEDPEMEFLKSLSTKQKKKLLRKLNKLSKKGESSSKKKKSKKLKKQKKKSLHKKEIEKKKKIKKSKSKNLKSSSESCSTCSSSSSSSDSDEKLNSKHRKRIKRHKSNNSCSSSNSSSDNSSESEPDNKPEKYLHHRDNSVKQSDYSDKESCSNSYNRTQRHKNNSFTEDKFNRDNIRNKVDFEREEMLKCKEKSNRSYKDVKRQEWPNRDIQRERHSDSHRSRSPEFRTRRSRNSSDKEHYENDRVEEYDRDESLRKDRSDYRNYKNTPRDRSTSPYKDYRRNEHRFNERESRSIRRK